MIRSAIVLVFLAAPAVAAPTGHRQPTPATVQQPGIDPAQPASTDGKAQAAQEDESRAKTQKELDQRQKAMDAKMKRTMGGICSGC